jgi:predicted lipoprotein with Yx(FWY)xxD motif
MYNYAMKINLKRLLLATGAVVVVAIAVGIVLTKNDMLPMAMLDEPTMTEKQAAPSASVPKTEGTMIASTKSEYGDILWGPNRQAIYIWEREPSATPQCYDDCAMAWPPVLTTGEPEAGAGIDAALLGTTKRSDGSTQVTYNEHPLYYYVHEGPGEVKCHNVATHGGLWWVITIDGVRGA